MIIKRNKSIKIILFWFGFYIFLFGIILFILKFENSNTALNDTISSVATPSPSPETIDWSLTAIGDIMLSRNVQTTSLKQPSKYLYPYEKIQNILTNDLIFANLETPLIAGSQVQSGTMVFRADIENAKALKSAGFNILSLANNHTPNQSQKGLISTFSTLTDAGIQYVGAGKNVQEAYSPKLTLANGYKVAWLAYNDRDVVPESYGAGYTSKGIDWAGTALMNESKLEDEIAQAKSLGQYVIVSMHSGTEYTAKPNESQKIFAHRSIDAGADLVIGHHPHVVQTVEKYQDKYIFYSLGNFIFDQMFSDETRRGLVLKINFSNNIIKKIELVPTVIENYAQPRVANEKEADWVLKRLQYTYISQDNKYYLNLD